MSSLRTGGGKWAFTAFLTVALLASAVILALLASTMPYDIDELDQLHTGYLYSRGQAPLVNFFDHPFIQSYKWTMGRLIPLLGESSILLYRCLSIACGLFALGALALALRKAIGPMAAGLAVVFLVVSVPFLARVHQVRPDALVLLLLALAAVLLTRVEFGSGDRKWVSAGLCAGAAAAFRPSLVVFPLAVALVLAASPRGDGDSGRLRRLIVFSIPAAGAAFLVFLAPFRWSTVLSVRQMIGATQNMLLQENALGAAGFWHGGTDAAFLLVVIAVAFVHFGFAPWVPRPWRRTFVLRSFLASAVLYSLVIFGRKICLSQDVLFLVFFAAPFVGILLERVWSWGRSGVWRWAAGVLVCVVLTVVGADTGVYLCNAAAPARGLSPEVRQVAYRHLIPGVLDGPFSMREMVTNVAPVIRGVIGMDAANTPRQVDATRTFFERIVGVDQLGFASNASHLFRLNPPSFTPPTLQHHTVWTPEAFDRWLEFSDRYFAFVQPIALEHGALVWGSNGLSANERICLEFKTDPPVAILLDGTFLDFMSRYPALEAFIVENYDAVFDPTAVQFFGVHRELGAGRLALSP